MPASLKLTVVVLKLPLSILYERLLLSREYRSPFVRQASWFENVVTRCVRYAFAYIPARIGRVFFSKRVALPFLRFRMMRHGYFRQPIHWQEVKQVHSSLFLSLTKAESVAERVQWHLDHLRPIPEARRDHLLCPW